MIKRIDFYLHYVIIFKFKKIVVPKIKTTITNI